MFGHTYIMLTAVNLSVMIHTYKIPISMSWSYLSSSLANFSDRQLGLDQDIVLWSLVLAYVVSTPLLLFCLITIRKQNTTQGFPFLELPAELRESIYELLIDREPAFPPPKTSAKTCSPFRWLISRRPTMSAEGAMMLLNRQISSEFVAVLCKKATFNLSFDEAHQPGSTSWAMLPAAVHHARRCNLWITATPSIMGSFGAHQMSMGGSGLWILRERLLELLDSMERLEHVRVHIYARGDRLWNPLWLWHCAGQTFKGISMRQLRSITFGLEGWSPGENHLSRNQAGQWAWECAWGHFIAGDRTDLASIRDFCAALYGRCESCESRAAAARRPVNG